MSGRHFKRLRAVLFYAIFPDALQYQEWHGCPEATHVRYFILVSSIHHLKANHIDFVFTDRHAYLKTARFSSNLDDLDWIIWPVLQKRDFKKDETDKVEKYQAEALVHRHVPLNALLGIVSYSDSVKAAVQAEAARAGATVKIISKSSWYL